MNNKEQDHCARVSNMVTDLQNTDGNIGTHLYRRAAQMLSRTEANRVELFEFAAAMHHHCQHSFKIKEGNYPCGPIYLLENTCSELLRLRLTPLGEDDEDILEQLNKALPENWQSAILKENTKLKIELAAKTEDNEKLRKAMKNACEATCGTDVFCECGCGDSSTKILKKAL